MEEKIRFFEPHSKRGIYYRIADGKDLRAIQELATELIKYEKKYDIRLKEDWPTSKIGEFSISNMIEKEIVIIAQREKEAVGFLIGGAHRDSARKITVARIENLFVKEKYRRKGIAAEMIRIFKNYATQRRANRLDVSVNVENKTAMAFYTNKIIHFEPRSVNLSKKI